MSFKSLVQSLFKLSGSQAMPSASGSVENTVSANSTVVAPFDGYATLRLASDSDYAIRYARILSSNLDSAVYATGSNTSNGMQYSMVYVPVRKGSNVSAIFAGVASGTIRFIKTVGASLPLLERRCVMSIKSLINALFKLSGGQAMPATSRIVIYEGSGTVEDQTYTPTKNGYFCVDNYSNESTARSFIQGSILNYVTQSGGRASIVLPVQKGQQVTYSASGSGNKTIRFFDLVGGG